MLLVLLVRWHSQETWLIGSALFETVIPACGMGSSALTAAIGARGFSDTQSAYVFELARVLAIGRGDETDKRVLSWTRRDFLPLAADGEISPGDVKTIETKTDEAIDRVAHDPHPPSRDDFFAAKPIAKALAIADAERLAKDNRKLIRAERALDITPPEVSAVERDCGITTPGYARRVANIQSEVRAQTKAIMRWNLTSDARSSAIAKELVPMLTSLDASVRARANLLMQDSLTTSYSYCSRDGSGFTCDWPSSSVVGGFDIYSQGALQQIATRTAIATKVIGCLSSEQLASLEPATAAMLMVGLYGGYATTLTNRYGEVRDRSTAGWAFVSSGTVDDANDGWICESNVTVPTDARTLAAIARLKANPPRNVTFDFSDDKLNKVIYDPRPSTTRFR